MRPDEHHPAAEIRRVFTLSFHRPEDALPQYRGNRKRTGWPDHHRNLSSLVPGTDGDVFDPVRNRIRARGRITKFDIDFLCYTLIDAIVDAYFEILESLGEEIEALEEVLIQNPDPETVVTIRRFKREMITLRKAIWPQREVLSALERADSPLISEKTGIYFRDVYDHTIQVIDAVETLRDITAGMLDLYLSTISFKMNEVMKVLTIIATIFIPLTFIAGVYGMNFENMPELYWDFGYHATLFLMFGVSLLMIVYFRKKRWI